jgi:hypothetical protein
MKRRRWIVVAIGVALMLGAAWWLTLDRLSDDEDLLVGQWADLTHSNWWILRGNREASGFDDRARRNWTGGGLPTVYRIDYRWRCAAGRLVFDAEPVRWRRTLRPALSFLGVPVGWREVYVIESRAGDLMTVIGPDGTRETWRHVPPD